MKVTWCKVIPTEVSLSENIHKTESKERNYITKNQFLFNLHTHMNNFYIQMLVNKEPKDQMNVPQLYYFHL